MSIWLAEIWRSWRAGLRKPGFVLLASGVLALGIGASVAVATLIGNTLLRPLPVPQASRLVVLGRFSDGVNGTISPYEYQNLGSLKGVTSLGLMRAGSSVNIAGADTPQRVPVIYVDRTLLSTLGLRPELGRNFNAHEDRPNGPKAVLLSHGLWRQLYGGDVHIVGRGMQIEGAEYLVVGVLPASFDAALDADAGGVVLPMALPAASTDFNENVHLAIARLADGVGIASVAAEIDARKRAMFRGMAMGDTSWPRFGAQSLASWQHQNARPMLLLFLASALLVLLISLVNLTNLMLLRFLSRNHDAAVRSALGAPWLRMVLPAMGEGLLIGLCGALAGMLLAVAGLTVLQDFWLQGGHLRIGALAWLLALAVGLLGAVLASVLALWRSRSAIAVDELREGGRSGIGVRSGRLGRALVVAQVALATILLCAAGVFMHALYDASRIQLGIASDHVLTFDLAPVQANYPDATALQGLSQRLVQRLRVIPGVTDATATTNLPTNSDLFGEFNNSFLTEDGQDFSAQYHAIDPDFFKLFHIALHEGRGFSRDDVRGGEPVAIVSQDLARSYYGGHALGKLIKLKGRGNAVWPARIVGVVGETYQFGPLQPKRPVLYAPLAQMPDPVLALFRNYEPLRFALRGQGNQAGLRAGVREALAEVAPGQPIANLRSMQSIVDQTTASARLSLWLIGLFASLALLLAAAGLYAVVAVAVAAREREFGVRTALGAQRSRLVRLVLGGGLLQIASGLLIGACGVIGLSRPLSVLLMKLLGTGNAFDPLTLAVVCAVLAIAGLLACLFPALRAARVPPMRALRGE